MSYRDLKKFTEIMRCLHYPRSISIDNFRTPNFELLADVLFWMVQKIDPSTPIHDGITTENDRVEFLNGIASEIATKVNVHLNTRKLYAADGHAVKELLKVAQVLYKASRLADETPASEETLHMEANLDAAKQARSLAREITEIGAKLHNLLKQEPDNRKERSRALKLLNSVSGITGTGSEKDQIEQSISHILDTTRDAAERLDKQCKMLVSNEKGMEEKIRKKDIDLERNSKRLESLKNVRPAFMDEYEQLEEELQTEYERYMVRFRNVDFLEGELLAYKNSLVERQEEAERTSKRMQKRFREDDLKIMCRESGDIDVIDAEDECNSSSDPNSVRSGEIMKRSAENMENELANSMTIDVNEISRIDELSSANTTPRTSDDASLSRSGGSPLEPSFQSGSFEDTVTGSEREGSLLLGDDSDDNF